MDRKIKNVVFDIGDVLVRFDETGHARRLFGDEKASIILEGLWMKGIGDDFDRGIIPELEIIKNYVSLSPKLEKEILIYIETLGECVSQFDYAIPWIDELKNNGFNVYFLSNYSDWFVRSNREALSFLSHMDGGVFSYKCHHLKPEREIYECLYKTYNLNPNECFFIDDLKRNIDGAKKTGMDGYVFYSYDEDHDKIMEILEK